MCFGALFHAFFVCFWRVVLAGTPQRNTRRDQSESAKTSFEDGSVFCFAPTVFSLFFCVFLCFLFFVFISVFLIARYFLFIRQKKNKKTQNAKKKKTQKNKTFFSLKSFCRARAPATAPSRTKFCETWGATGSTDLNAFEVRQRTPFGASARHGPTSRTAKWRQKDTLKAPKMSQKSDKKRRQKPPKNQKK